MDLRDKLRAILDRLELSRVELELQPEYFQATAELRLASGTIAEILDSLGPPGEDGAVIVLFPLRPRDREAAPL